MSTSFEALIASQNVPVRDDDDDEDDGIGEDFVDEVIVKMLKGAPNKQTILIGFAMQDIDRVFPNSQKAG